MMSPGMGTRRGSSSGPLVLVGVALVLAVAAYSVLFGGAPSSPSAGSASQTPQATATARPTTAPRPPEVAIAHDTCCAQTARFIRATWTSTETVQSAVL